MDKVGRQHVSAPETNRRRREQRPRLTVLSEDTLRLCQCRGKLFGLCGTQPLIKCGVANLYRANLRCSSKLLCCRWCFTNLLTGAGVLLSEDAFGIRSHGGHGEVWRIFQKVWWCWCLRQAAMEFGANLPPGLGIGTSPCLRSFSTTEETPSSHGKSQGRPTQGILTPKARILTETRLQGRVS